MGKVIPIDPQTEKLEVEITRYMERANQLNAANGGIAIEECLSREDIATLEQAAAICSFAATILSSWGEDAALINGLVATGGTLLATAKELDNPARNWTA